MFSGSVICQINLQEIIELKSKSEKKCVDFFLQKGFTIIDKSTNYIYWPIEQADDNPYKEDSCTWASVGMRPPIYSDTELSIKDLEFEIHGKKYKSNNIEITRKISYNFGENYNRTSKTASKFVEINFVEEINNANCKNIFHDENLRISKSIEIQFNDKNEWVNFKNDIIKIGEYITVLKLSDEIPLKVLYDIEYRPFENKVLNTTTKNKVRICYEEYDDFSLFTITHF